MGMDLRIVMALVAALAVPMEAQAADQGPREACAGDAQTFCGNLGDGQQVRSCLEDHYKDVSDACYAALKNAAPPDDQPTEAQNEGPPHDDNGPPPQNGNGPPPGGRRGGGGGPREACRADAESFCPGVQPGGGRIIACLQDHYKDLSDNCYTALKNLPPPPQGGR